MIRANIEQAMGAFQASHLSADIWTAGATVSAGEVAIIYAMKNPHEPAQSHAPRVAAQKYEM